MLARAICLIFGSALACVCASCHPAPPELKPATLPPSFIEQLTQDGTWDVKFREDAAQLARMTDAEFEQMLTAYKSMMASSAKVPNWAVDAAIEKLRHERDAARSQNARPGGAGE
jgi:hypothetical protein